jgi:hypothetical protein
MKPKSSLVFILIVIFVTTTSCGKAPALAPQPATQAPAGTTLPPTVSPTPQPTPTFTPTPSGPCMNVFYPFVPGYQWIYQADDGNDNTDDLTKVGLTVSAVDGSQAKVDALDLSTGVITHTTADCKDGAIQNYPLLTVGTLFGEMLTGQLNITYVEGVFMPAERDLAAANWISAWTGDYRANGTFSATEEGETTTLTLADSPVHMEWSLVGKDPITIKAGTFSEAYKVTRMATVDASLQMEGSAIKGKLIVNTSQWYAAGVGLLKSVVNSTSIVYRGVTFPTGQKSRVELLEFRSGQ